MRTDEQARIEAKMDTMIGLLRELVGLMHEGLSRPRPTTVHLSAYSEIQLKRFAVVLVEVIKSVLKGVPPI
jgi:hypothetical protein